MDNIDQAQVLEQLSRDAAIKNARRTQATKGTVECIGCDSKIPVARRRAHPTATRCIGCQAEYEATQ